MNNGFYNPGTDPQGGAGSMGGDGGLIGAIINAGAGMYDSYQQRKTSKENTNRTIAAQREQAELAYQRAVEMWHRQNLYNTPQAQMERFKQAGLNPHLIYGQGSPGNAASPPEYHPPDLQYRYQAAQYGSSLQGILPTLMSVGTWMQNMRLSQKEIESKDTSMQRTRQLMDYLAHANPALLKALENKLELFPYQKQMQDYQQSIARQKLYGIEQDFRHQFGEELFMNMGSMFEDPKTGSEKKPPIGGMKRLQFLEQESKTKLAEAKASWTDLDITDPQAIMMLVLNGVMGMAGMTLRSGLQKRPSGKRVVPRERPRGLNRRRMSVNHPDR